VEQKRKVGILELLTGDASIAAAEKVYYSLFRRQLHGVMAQTIAAWCRRRGHSVSYVTYYGQTRPDSLVPADCDFIFVSAYTEASALCYALARIFKRRGATTVLGGPHARAFPRDAIRFFDLVVIDCDEVTIGDIVANAYDPGSIVDAQRQGFEVPPLAERAGDLVKASSYGFGKCSLSVVPLLASTGCPYTCDFCVDWNSRYRVRSASDLLADLNYAAAHFPGQITVFYDPNFGVNFDKTISTLEQVEPERRNPYIMESSLSILKPHRLGKLRDTKCIYIAPGVESWVDYGSKSGTGSSSGEDKYVKVSSHFGEISNYVPGLQVNFIFGTDSDKGVEPVELTKRFIRHVPNVFPGLNSPIAYGGTPMYDSLKAENRLLHLAPIFYSSPVLNFTLKHYEPVVYLDYLIELFEESSRVSTIYARARACTPWQIKIIDALRAFYVRSYVKELRDFAQHLRDDAAFRRFHEGREGRTPTYYHARLDRRLGSFSALLLPAEREYYVA
jgi:hypothetical protein